MDKGRYREELRALEESCKPIDEAIARQSVKSEEVGRNNLLLVEIKHLVQTEDMDIWNYKNELISLLDEAIARQSATSEEVAEAIEYFEDIFTYIAGAPSEPKYRLAITALQAYQPWIPCTERMPTEDDADEDGFVLTLDADRQQTDYPYSEIEAWNNRCDVKITHWRPMLPIPKGE